MSLTGEKLGQYLVGEHIGGGAMGVVYRAYPNPAALEEVVALKVLHPEFAQEDEFRARFEREMRALTSLAHPHIVPIVDFGAQNKYLYLVMRYINGQTLATLMARRAFSPRFAWGILEPVAMALQYGHDQDILHRDVKPSNIMLERVKGALQVYLMDYGLAKKLGADDTLTDTGISIGTPEYMSPEAALGNGTADQRTDVYSLATLTYELLVGILPFDKGNAYLTALAQVNEAPRPLTDLHPHFPPTLSAVVMQSLAKRVEERHQSVTEFANAFAAALERLSPEERDTEYWVK